MPYKKERWLNIKDYKSFYNFLDKHNMNLHEINCKYSKQVFELLFFKNQEHKIIWMNKKEYLLNKYNMTEKDLFNKACYEIFFQRNNPCPDCPLTKCRETLEPQKCEKIFPNDDTYILRVFPVKNTNNKLTGFIQILTDITQKRKLKENLKHKNRKIDLFTNLSHELRTPLNLMHSALHIIKMHFGKLDIAINEKEKFEKYFNLIKQNNYRLMKIVNNIMDLQKMDSGNYKINFQNNDIVKSIKNTTFSSYEYANSQGKNLKFSSNIEKKIIPYDPYEIERVILNLLSNAFKYTNNGDNIEVNIKDGKKYITIIIKDTGIGIPEEKQNQIFNKFLRVDDSFYRKSEGTGLGLSIVKFIIEMHGGNIMLESKYKKGTKFILKLPIKQEKCVIEDSDKTKKVDSMIDRLDIEYSDIYM